MSLARRGLSLIEVVIVLALITVLMALSLPMLSTANAQARSLVCRQNLADMGEIITNFTMDFERLPVIGQQPPEGDGLTLHAFIAPRVQSPCILFCPSDETAQSHDLGTSYVWSNAYNDTALSDIDNALGQPLLADREAFHHSSDITANQLLLQRDGNQYLFSVTGTETASQPGPFTHNRTTPQREISEHADDDREHARRDLPNPNHTNPPPDLDLTPAPPQSEQFRPLGN